tara:strand:+ start:2842 stop:3240 length:399 start_codon:yes stop_codon:yes gene_type:complete
MQYETTVRRIGIFHSVEVQEQLVPGEWVRNDEASTQRLPDMVNDFLVENECQVLSVSPPSVEHVETSGDGTRRSYRASVSIIYDPTEEINDETAIQTQIDIKAQEFAEELSRGLSGTLGDFTLGQGPTGRGV